VEHQSRVRPEKNAARRAVWIARRIEHDLHAGRWPLGAVYSSQSELRRRYGGGDESLREAIRLLEFNGVARMRPGPGGGLLVERPALSLVVASVLGHFQSLRSTPRAAATSDLIDSARASLAAVAAGSASERAASDQSIVSRLRQAFLHPGKDDLTMMLTAVLEDPCLHIGACCLHGLARLVASAERAEASHSDATLDVDGEALLADIATGRSVSASRRAYQLALRHRASTEDLSLIPDPFVSHDSPLRRSRVGRLVHRIAADLNQGPLREHGYLGSEAVLAERYSVARSTLRQALLVLEDADIIAARRGRGLGWFICEPNPELPLRQIRNYLASCHVSRAHAREVVNRWRLSAPDGSNAVLELLLLAISSYAGS